MILSTNHRGNWETLNINFMSKYNYFFKFIWKAGKRGVDLNLFFYIWLLFLVSSSISVSIRYIHAETLFRYSKIHENLWLRSLTNNAKSIEIINSTNKKFEKEGDNYVQFWKVLSSISIILFLWWLMVLMLICHQIIN